MNMEFWDIVLIAIIIGAFCVCLYGLKMVIKEGFLKRWNLFAGFVFGLLLVSYLIYNVISHEIDPKDWALIFLTLGLVMVTGLYALVAFRQANASIKMAEEMREQKYAEALPLLIPTVRQILPSVKLPELPYESFVSAMEVKVMWRNVGKGVALASRLSLLTIPNSSGKSHQPLFPDAATIEVGSQIEVDYYKLFNNSLALETMEETPKGYQPRLEAEYRDIYGRRIVTIQEIRYDEKSTRASLGELYFRVNDRRLGEEGL